MSPLILLAGILALLSVATINTEDKKPEPNTEQECAYKIERMKVEAEAHGGYEIDESEARELIGAPCLKTEI